MITALGVTLISYPFDIAHCRMACDVSKKPTLLQATKRDKSNGMYVQHQTRADRTFKSVRECLEKSEHSRGLRIALLSQVPYTAVMLTTFSLTHRMFSTDEKF